MIIETIFDALSPFKLPIYLQGTLGDNPYPDQFITYWITDSEGNTYYDNAENTTDWNVSIMYYSKNISEINEKVPQLVSALKAKKFIMGGKGNFIPSDEPDTLGWVIDCYYSEKN